MRNLLNSLLLILLLSACVKSRDSGYSYENYDIDISDRIDDFKKDKNSILYIKIIKSKRKLYTFNYDKKLIKAYKIALGKNPIGKKRKEGDMKTPEGIYMIDAKNPDSAYHLSLKISYPNQNDLEFAKKLFLKPGNNIMIHGIKNGLGYIGKSHADSDWTEGCIAVSDEEIEEIYSHTIIGTVVEIAP